MVERFLRYSYAHNRRIYMMLACEAGVKRVCATVTQIDEGSVLYMTARAKKPVRAALADILSAAYARGDAGDTLENELREKT